MIEPRRAAHPRLVWIVEHLIVIYIALAVSVLAALAILEAIQR